LSLETTLKNGAQSEKPKRVGAKFKIKKMLDKNVKFWEVLGWICLVLFFLTGAIYFFWDDSYTESPNWLIAAIGCWFYRDHLLKGSTGK
jgi:hypothetical protein